MEEKPTEVKKPEEIRWTPFGCAVACGCGTLALALFALALLALWKIAGALYLWHPG